MPYRFAAALVGLLCFVCFVGEQRTPPHGASDGFDLGPVSGFVANRGQWRKEVRFAASNGGGWVAVTECGLELGHGLAAVRMHTLDCETGVATGCDEQVGRCHFLVGPSSRHVRGVAVYARVAQELAPGVRWEIRRAHAGGFAYDLFVEPTGTALPEIVVRGCEHLRVEPDTGALEIETAHGVLRQSAPIAWRDARGHPEQVACRFLVTGKNRYTFDVDLSRDGALCIDPDLVWQAAVGGSLNTDQGHAVGVADNGDVFVAGSTLASNLPTTTGVFDPTYSGAATLPQQVGDGFVARLAAADGSLLWCTYLGGSENDRISEAQGHGDEVVLSGWTTSLDFPITPGAFHTAHNGVGDGVIYLGGDVFVTRLSGDGTQLVWSSFLGGAQLEYPTSMAVTPAGEVWVSGHTHSLNFPTTPGAWSATRAGFSDAFVARFAANGTSLLASTYFGGSVGEEYPYAMALGDGGSVIIAGATDSLDLPATAGALGQTFHGGNLHFADGFFARFDATASSLEVCSYLGTGSNEFVRGMVRHDDGTMTFTGQIDGPGLPTSAGLPGATPFGDLDAFAWRVTADGSQTVAARYFGGSDSDRFDGCVGLGGGRVAVVGQSRTASLAHTPGSAGPGALGNNDGWIVRLSADGLHVDYSAVLGGSSSDYAVDVDRTPDGALVVVGTTYGGPTFVTTPGAPGYGGFGDAFCTRLWTLPEGVSRRGAASGSCGRDVRIMTRAHAAVGSTELALSAGTLPTTSPALAVFSSQLLVGPLAVLGFDLWLDPTTVVGSYAVAVDTHGAATFDLPIANSAALAGATLGAQFVWLDACPGLAFQASDAVAIVVQP